MILRDYQQQVIDKVVAHLKDNKRCCVSLATGGGKTVIFSEVVNLLHGRTLVCVHREELVHQTSSTLSKDHDLLLPKVKTISKDICVAMVQTLHNRIKKGAVDVNTFDNLIIDEAHRGEFMKILNGFNGNVIGFTATPNYEKSRMFYKCLKCGDEQDKSGKCCKRKLKKYRENVPLAVYYHTLIEGIGINELIEKDFLVQDENFVLPVDTSRLVYNEALGKYTEESIGLVFGSDDAIANTLKTFHQLAGGKKTMIFNPNTLVNKKLYQAMLKAGLNVKMYDSNNKEENRKDLIQWFKDTPDAILLNVQVFTTGFDCTDVEVIFLNKKTKSVNLFLQMVGRGGRITEKIFKPKFRVIDMGNNAEDFGKWSDKREWHNLFYNKEIKLVGAAQPAAVRTCHECESIIAANSLKCEICGVERSYNIDGGSVLGLPIRQGKVVIPKPKQIIEYCEKHEVNILNARKIVYNYISEMFYNTSFEVVRSTKASGELFHKTKYFIIPYYFAIQESTLEGNKARTINSFTNETIKQIERRYSTIETV
jgi:superfamily II DNA or RNA helicase